MKTLSKDPFNIIVAGVGGQGNVLMSMLLGKALVNKGYLVSVADTYGASQRGGSVASHVRISEHSFYSSSIPCGRADIILSLEPVETLRMLGQYGNPNVITITDARPLYPPDVGCGLATYPDIDDLLVSVKKLSAKLITVRAADEALKLGNPIFANVILIGALIGSGVTPLERESVEAILKEQFSEAYDINIAAFNKGIELAGVG